MGVLITRAAQCGVCIRAPDLWARALVNISGKPKNTRILCKDMSGGPGLVPTVIPPMGVGSRLLTWVVYEPWSKLLIRGLQGLYMESLLKGYKAPYEEFGLD